MNRSEEVKVGLFVLATVALLLLTLVLVGGFNILQKPMNAYTLRTRFAGGLDTGAPVRYAGIKVGRVEGTRFDPEDPTRVVIAISVNPKTPVRTDSKAQVSALGMLGEYYVEISPGSPEASPLPTGGEIQVEESVQWTQLVNRVGAIAGEAEGVLGDAGPRLNQVLDNVTELTGEENRRHLERLLSQMDEMVTEARPQIRSALAHVDSASAKIDQFMGDIQSTREVLDQLLASWSGLTSGEDAEVQQALRNLRQALTRAEQTLDEVRRLLVANRQHLDVSMENFRVSSENIREFTDTIKQRPYSLVRIKNPPDRKPGDPAPQK